MVAGPEGFVARWWRGEAGVAGSVASVLTLPAAAAYRGVTTLRNMAFDRGLLGVDRAEVPVISIGNLTVGGTGKTPFAGWVVRELLADDRTPALLCRGYGSDEPLLHARWNPDARVVTNADRPAGAREAVRAGADIIVLDDGFQHRRLRRDLDIVLVAQPHGVRGRLLPRGPFRESVRALSRADVVVLVDKGSEVATMDALAHSVADLRPDLPHLQVRFAPGSWHLLDGQEAERPEMEDLLGVTSVADPGAFGPFVTASTGATVSVKAYPDHHEYSEADVREITDVAAGRTVVTTEKDSVKLVRFAPLLPDVRVLSLRLEWQAGERIVRRHLRSLYDPDTHG
ncbi:MAG: tetraacyldisaccharide 4'-kinase [Gemmatimonadota bacterium]|nr:MAG: tetraacyldisaccharide 4'-kinase [Gemmatimonadota bacterium]